jgi:regulator of protease activity HflC (stomatin/prohibitin superfamily)
MILFILGVLIFLIGAGCIVASVVLKTDPDAAKVRWSGVGAVAFSLLLVLLSCARTVGTQDVGVVTQFGALNGDLSNGLHFVAPWDKVTPMDAAIQTNNHTGKECMNVRIANQQTACVDVTIRWRIVPGQADPLYKNYHSFTNVTDSLVTRELASAVNNQLTTYNPLNSITLGTIPAGGAKNPSLTTVAGLVDKQMKGEIGSQIEVLKVIIPIITFDPETQSRINQLQQQIALTRIAEQEVVTNQAQSEANNVLARSVDTNTNVLVAQCLNILSTMVKNGQRVPVGFSCWPGGSGVSGVIVNTGK